MNRVAVVISSLALLGASGCGTTSSMPTDSSTSPASRAPVASTHHTSARAWTGFGARLSDWESVHPRNLASCSAGTCYGNQVQAGGQMVYEFRLLDTTGAPGYRVDSYEQAFDDGTPLSLAKREVLALFPRDTKTTAFWVAHGTSGSCALWNLRSRTLGRWLSEKRVGDQAGDVGVALSTVARDGTEGFRRTNVNDATVNIAPAQPGTTC